MLITTNLDNDDGLAVDFSERIRSVETTHRRVAVYAARGLIKSANTVFLRTDRHNAFCSVRSWLGRRDNGRPNITMSSSQHAGGPT